MEPDPPVIGIRRAAQLAKERALPLGSESKIYRLVRSPEPPFKAERIFGRWRIGTASYVRYLDGLVKSVGGRIS